MLDGSDVALKGGCAADVWDRTDAIVMFFSAYFSSNHIPPPELRPRRLQTGLSIRGFFLPTVPPGTPARGAWQTRDGGSTSTQGQPLIRRRRRHGDTRIRLPPLACRGGCWCVGRWANMHSPRASGGPVWVAQLRDLEPRLGGLSDLISRSRHGMAQTRVKRVPGPLEVGRLKIS